MFQWGLWLPCLQIFRTTCFKFMFLSCSNIKSMFLCQGHLSHHGVCFCFKAMFQYPCFYIKCLFLYQINLSNHGDVLIDRFLCLLRSIFCFQGYRFLCLYVSLTPSIQKTFIQNLNCLFVSFHVLCLLFSTCVTFSLVLFFNVLHSRFIIFLVDWLGGTLGEAPSNENVKNITIGVDSPKPRLHQKKTVYFRLLFVTKFQSQETFCN